MPRQLMVSALAVCAATAVAVPGAMAGNRSMNVNAPPAARLDTPPAVRTSIPGVVITELAGNPLATYPYFEYVTAFNFGSAVNVALDPTMFPGAVGQTCDIYIVAAKTEAEWTGDASLTDMTGGAQTETIIAGTIQANTFSISGAATLSADAGLGLGRPYDVVLDFNQNGVLDAGDYIDGLDLETRPVPRHGMYVVHDLTLPGPLAVTEIIYAVDAGSVTSGFESEDAYYPTDIASMGQLPLIVVSHGNGHNYQWYDHIGYHMASYGYVVMSHANNTVPGVFTASTTTLEHTDAFLDQLDTIGAGVLNGHIDTSRITWLGHSRGGEGVAIAVDRIFDGDWTPVHYSLEDIVLVSSIAPVDFLEGGQTDPHGVNYHLWTGGSDNDVNGGASCNLCQTFHLHDRAEEFRQSISLHGVGHGDFHDGGGSSVATGPCLVGRPDTHLIMKGYFLPLVKHYVEGNVPAKDYLWRQYESFHAIGAPTGSCIVADLMYREGPGPDYFALDHFQSNSATTLSSSGGTVSFSVATLSEGRLDDANSDFTHNVGDAMNGMTVGGNGDDTAGVVFEWTADSYYEQEIIASQRDLSDDTYIQFRACQATRHPNTIAALEDLTFTVTLRDVWGISSSINIGAYGGGIEEPYQRTGDGSGTGWANEFETIRIRLTDFLHNGSGLDITEVEAVRFEFGPSFGSAVGRLGMDDIALSNNGDPAPVGSLRIGLVSGETVLIAPGNSSTMVVNIAGAIENLVPGTATMHYRFDNGAFIDVPMTGIGGDQYQATLPAPGCDDDPQFYFSAVGDLTGQTFLPRGAPADLYTPNVGTITMIYEETMDTNPGWDISGGAWAHGVPTGQGGGWGSAGPDPTSGFTGPNVYGYNLDGNYTNNMPEYHLTTPAIDCSAFPAVSLKFMRWLCVETSTYDHAYLRVSNNGTTWTTVWENGGEIGDSDWIPVEYDISAVAANQSTVYIRWTMGTTDGSWLYAGWNIDDVQLFAVGCSDTGCPEDLVAPVGVEQQDLNAVLNRWGDPDCLFGGPAYPCVEDLVAPIGVEQQDLNAVLNRWGDPDCE